VIVRTTPCALNKDQMRGTIDNEGSSIRPG
jgi:hypothetical protein